ncbi:hypothetical protein EDD85DRAFT_942977 [Armillaria nabsnona]|nr:hypothetical protein EDD85DRAFT_942977 [Armillaria nabsnona]
MRIHVQGARFVVDLVLAAAQDSEVWGGSFIRRCKALTMHNIGIILHFMSTASEHIIKVVDSRNTVFVPRPHIAFRRARFHIPQEKGGEWASIDCPRARAVLVSFLLPTPFPLQRIHTVGDSKSNLAPRQYISFQRERAEHHAWTFMEPFWFAGATRHIDFSEQGHATRSLRITEKDDDPPIMQDPPLSVRQDMPALGLQRARPSSPDTTRQSQGSQRAR